MRDRILEVNQEMVNKLTNISGNYEKYDGTLLDNYIFHDTQNIRICRSKPRAFILIKEKYLNEWNSTYEMVMTDNFEKVLDFRNALLGSDMGNSSLESIEVENKTENEGEGLIKNVLKIEQKYISEDRSFYRVTSSVGLANFATNLIGNNASESLLVMCLNTKNEVIAYSEVFKGGINQSVAIPREIFQLALLNNSAKIAVSHNHPSGYEFPSENDKSFTTNLKNAGKTIGIELLDHIIVTSKNTSYYSFQENGSL